MRLLVGEEILLDCLMADQSSSKRTTPQDQRYYQRENSPYTPEDGFNFKEPLFSTALRLQEQASGPQSEPHRLHRRSITEFLGFPTQRDAFGLPLLGDFQHRVPFDYPLENQETDGQHADLQLRPRFQSTQPLFKRANTAPEAFLPPNQEGKPPAKRRKIVSFKRSRSSSRFKGVLYVKDHKKWRAQICIRGKKTYLGSYENEIDAAKARDKKVLELFGPDSKLLNFKQEGSLSPDESLTNDKTTSIRQSKRLSLIETSSNSHNVGLYPHYQTNPLMRTPVATLQLEPEMEPQPLREPHRSFAARPEQTLKYESRQGTQDYSQTNVTKPQTFYGAKPSDSEN